MSTVRISHLPADEMHRISPVVRAYRQHLYAELPDLHAAIDEKYGDAVFETLLADLATYHAPPKGAVLVAQDDSDLLGTVMLNPIEGVADAAEIQRLFVMPQGRKLGLGRNLMTAAFAVARAAGYKRILLDTGPGLLPAIALYKDLGFKSRGPYKPLPPGLAANAIFFERTL